MTNSYEQAWIGHINHCNSLNVLKMSLRFESPKEISDVSVGHQRVTIEKRLWNP